MDRTQAILDQHQETTAAGVMDAFRRYGYLAADLDPMGRLLPETEPLAELAAGTETSPETAEARRWYCGSIGIEYMHIIDPARRRFLAERMEREAEAPDRRRLLDLLVRGETFEQVIQQRYLGSKRFSIEGVTSLLPLLDGLLETAAELSAEQAVLAMPHRGRLSVMAITVGRPAAELFAGFEDVDPKSILGSGDVKYHMGATGVHAAKNGRELRLHLVSNPSHLEAVDSVAMGRARAKLDRIGDPTGRKVLGIVMHGDAAFAGQGVVAETLNMAELEAYQVGGTIQVVVNNLIGFTTEPKNLHSSRFATDIAKRLPVPIFHVNAEDPEAVARVARMACEYRYEFASDVVIDLIGYRRHGHSEVDDPTITQPTLYKKIAAFAPTWKNYARQLAASSALAETEAEGMVAAYRAELYEAQRQAEELEKKPTLRTLPPYWSAFSGGAYKPAYEVPTAVSAERLGALAEGLTRAPEGFHVHDKIKKLLEQRLEMGRGTRPIDYGMAEALAFASLVTSAVPVRFSGQDCRRGTFNQRHSVLIDTENGRDHLPLQHLEPGQARFEVYDSLLSEAAVLGYEYGYSRDFPEALVIWEAQFGDFANGAQIILDQFVTAGEDKWGLLSGLVLLLPHGYEGQGPEHSSARIERFLQLAAEDNIQVCQPSTAGQYFHLLRRQALRKWRKPLIVFTPKSMLRHKDSSSSLAELTDGGFQNVVPDRQIQNARRILLCSGKIGHELLRERERRGDSQTAVAFLDQLYPFPGKELEAIFAAHPDARDIVWVQEEPANMGALFFVQPRIERLLRRPIRSVKRSASGSPATGSATAHTLEQKTLITMAFGIG
ncbi:MAG TPA: 2-oxoglutarate dehydrogenase E1 component [Thermoanaerobaculia bacterium]|jgi:2-oxoglutarate dehydrogenase E1 component|nr:2-oxoglutarate dehydrogenase E1 component [Thermoanaerobaculia bacterium]